MGASCNAPDIFQHHYFEKTLFFSRPHAGFESKKSNARDIRLYFYPPTYIPTTIPTTCTRVHHPHFLTLSH